jgi:hypothetical protein
MITDSAAIAVGRILGEDAQYRRTAKGLARSLVWREGLPPAELGENFGGGLTLSLLNQSDRVLLASLRLIESDVAEQVTSGRQGFHRAAEGYESLLRNGDPADPRRYLNIILAAACYHLAGYAASAFSILRLGQDSPTAGLILQALRYLLQRNLSAIDELMCDPSRALTAVLCSSLSPGSSAVVLPKGAYRSRPCRAQVRQACSIFCICLDANKFSCRTRFPVSIWASNPKRSSERVTSPRPAIRASLSNSLPSMTEFLSKQWSIPAIKAVSGRTLDDSRLIPFAV